MKKLIVFMFLILQVGCNRFDVKKDLVYKTVDGRELRGDVYQPNISGLKPAVIVVHGGWWARRSGDMEGICRDLARAGFVAFNITYRLAPESHYPKAREDVSDAISWFKLNASKFEVDTNRIAAWGYSAGAHLILLVGLNPELNLKALVGGGSPTDLTYWPHSPMITDFIGATYAEKTSIWEEASPVNHVQSHSPPVFLYHGALDNLVDPIQMDLMKKALNEKNVPVETYKAPFLGHILTYAISQKSVDLGIKFIEEHTQQGD